MKLRKATLLAFSILSAVDSARAEIPRSFVDAMVSQGMVKAGRESFLARCAGCHGVEADGNGPAAPMLNPRPRNLLTGMFKLRSTAMGVLPTAGDLLRTINEGIPGSAMPPFRELSEPEKLALVAYLRSLRPEFAATRADQLPVPVPEPPATIFHRKATLLQAASRGKSLYDKSCIACHGPKGAGDGPSAETLTDNDDRPIRPADLRGRGFKSGRTVKDIFKVLVTGFDGSPMPAFTETFSESQRWDIVAYVFYLRGVGAGIYREEELP